MINKAEYSRFDRVNLTTGEIKLVAIGKPDTDGWLVDRGGVPAAESRYDTAKSSWSLRVRRGEDCSVREKGRDELCFLEKRKVAYGNCVHAFERQEEYEAEGCNGC